VPENPQPSQAATHNVLGTSCLEPRGLCVTGGGGGARPRAGAAAALHPLN